MAKKSLLKFSITILSILAISSLIYMAIPKTLFRNVQNGIIISKDFPESPYLKINENHSLGSNTVMDCKGLTVTNIIYDDLNVGIIIGEDKQNITVKNCVVEIKDNYKEANFGIFISSLQNKTNNIRLDNNSVFIDNGFRVRGIEILGGNNINVTNNHIVVRGNRSYGVRTQADNNDIIIANNYISGEVINDGTFTTPLETSNWINKYAYNIIIKDNKIICISNNKEDHFAIYIADTKDSFITDNYIYTKDCSPLWSIRSSKNRMWNNMAVEI